MLFCCSRYDYGTDCNSTTMFEDSCNQAEYNSLAPPEYEISLITTPTVILKGTADVLSTADDIAEQERRLQIAGSHVATIEYAGYSHMDFIWQRQNQQHITDMIKYAKQYADGTY
jgi:pimeloyl-ACP methyl ester carboxylesterase